MGRTCGFSLERTMHCGVESRIAPLVLLLAAGLPASALAQAAANGSSTQNPTSSVFGIGLLLVYLTRRKEIGGWLFYYYMQLYVSVVLTTVFTFMSIDNLDPSKWPRSDRYVWFLVSWLPVILAQCAEVAAATYLLAKRTEQNVRRVRYALLALLITSAVAVSIDITVFSESASAVMDGMTLVFSAIWLWYFYTSVRVQRVFIDHTWVFHDPPPKTPGERRYLRNRAALWGIVLYVVGFVVVGIGEGDKKPDPPLLFGLPLFYSLFAALISYACPISKKKRATLGLPAGI